MFDTIASYYDGTNRILSLGFDSFWRTRSVKQLSPIRGGIYLDVGCGTGDIALEILRQAPDCHVVGIDPSEGMLARGRTKVQEAGLSREISLEMGDVLNLRFDDNHFDAAITSFCIRNVTNRRRGLSEIYRVIRPAGKLVILELTQPTGFIMGPLFKVYANVVMPLVTKVMSSVSAYRYLADSMVDFPRPDLVLELMRETGFVNRKYVHMTGGIVTLFVGEVPEEEKRLGQRTIDI